MSAAAPTTASKPASTAKRSPASAAPRNAAMRALVTSAADSSPSGLSAASDAPQSRTVSGHDSSMGDDNDSSIGNGHGSSMGDDSDSPTAARALTPRGGYYLNRSTGRVVSWAQLKDMEREGEGDMTYFCVVM